MNSERKQEILRIVNASSPGPWLASTNETGQKIAFYKIIDANGEFITRSMAASRENMELIVQAKEIICELLEELDS